MDLKISVNRLIIFILVFSIIYPFGYYLFVPQLSVVYKFGKYLVLAIGLLYLIYKKYKPSKVMIGITLLELYIGIVTLLKGGTIETWLNFAAPAVSLGGLTDYALKKYPKYIISALTWISAFHLLLNTILGSRMATELSTYWLGIRVRIGSFAFPAMAFALIYFWMAVKEKRSYWNTIIGILPAVIIFFTSISFFLDENVSTAILTLALFVLFIVVFMLAPNFLLSKSKVLLLVFIFVNLGVVFLGMQSNFEWIISLLEKNLSLTGRTIIWEGVISHMGGNWLFGRGVGSGIPFNARGVTYEHNQMLNFLFTGGLIALAIFVIILFLTIDKLTKVPKNFFVVVALSAIFAICIEMISEHPFENALFAALLITAVNINEIVKLYYTAPKSTERILKGSL